MTAAARGITGGGVTLVLRVLDGTCPGVAEGLGARKPEGYSEAARDVASLSVQGKG